MNGKKILGFLLCKSAFTQRNLTSVFLVGVFFCVYVLAGGKITTRLPRPGDVNKMVNESGTEALFDKEENSEEIPSLSNEDSKSVLGVVPSEDRSERQFSRNLEGRLFSPEEREELENDEPIDEDGLVEGVQFINRREQMKLKKSERKPRDSLSAIEERLKIKKRQ